jgi:hypothetical protein
MEQMVDCDWGGELILIYILNIQAVILLNPYMITVPMAKINLTIEQAMMYHNWSEWL